MLSNDERGWVLSIFSGIACVFGSSIICLDVICRMVPQWRNFNVRESKSFLAASLSLSFGVMCFSALYGLLPEARSMFLKSGMPPDQAAYAVMGFFLLGAAGLQLVSELLHRCLPSSIVKCEEHGKESRLEEAIGYNEPESSASEVNDELTPLLDDRTSIKKKISSVLVGRKQFCDAQGRCYGYQDHLCKQQCSTNPPTDLAEINECASESSGTGAPKAHHGSAHDTEASLPQPQNGKSTGHKSIWYKSHEHSRDHGHGHDDHNPKAGHHHVAQNKFLSIGVQTSIAIALHKIPEGFITYATNHTSPELGISVFLAIFIHNIAEGFAMSLPLFLALKSRLMAILWASLLGGLAQPIGAGIAMFTLRDRSGEETDGSGYIFAITAGIMCSVGLQLFCQAVQIHHDSRLPLFFGFLGMAMLGLSFALTAGHHI
ncbi:Zinc transporter [Rhizina undulata]